MLPNFDKLATAVGKALKKKSLKITTAESCTGGWAAQAITSIAGSSEWFDCGFITYSYDSKIKLLDIPKSLLLNYGAVSEEVARQMAEGALKNSNADISLSITGIAGPGGATPDKPVGTVWFAWANKHQKTETICKYFQGNREQIRAQSVEFALSYLIENFLNE